MTQQKIRVSDLAKDFGVANKVIIDLLAQYVEPAKKTNSVLEEDELDLVFEGLSNQFAPENLDAYFATANEPKPEKPQAEKPTEKKAEEAPAPAAMNGMTTGNQKKAEKADKPVAPKVQKERRTVDTR